MLTDTSALINDIEQDYKKLSSECKKKYNTIREVIEISVKTIEKLKEVSSDRNQFFSELALAVEILIKPIVIITENKHKSLYLYCVIIFKKLVTYNFVSLKESPTIVKLLKEIYDNSTEDIQLKILETLQSMINSNKMVCEDDTINKVLAISCKMFMMKNIEFKNPIRLLFKTLVKSVFDNLKDNKDKKATCLNLVKNLLEISEGKKKDWISSSIYSKCLGIELLCYLVESFSESFLSFEELKNFVNNDIEKCIKKTLPITNDGAIGIKLSRLSILIIKKLNFGFDLIELMIKFAEKDNLSWQKIIGLECLSEIFLSSKMIKNLFLNNFSLYENLINCLTELTYKNILNKKSESSTKKGDSSKGDTQTKIKYIDNSIVIIEGESISLTVSNSYLQKLITDCYMNIRSSFISLMEESNLKVNQINTNLTDEQKKVRDIINFKYVPIKGALTGLLLNSSDEGVTQTYLNIFQSLISIYATIGLPQVRDEYLNDLCKLAIPNNLENTLQMKEKNILITRTIFNMAHCVNLLDYNSWVLLIETIQNLYYMLINSGNYMLRPGDQFEIDLIIRNIQMNIKKYSYDTPSNEIQEIIRESELNTGKQITEELNMQHKSGNNIKKKGTNTLAMPKKQMTPEERDNIQILSNVVDTLFIDSTLFDDKTLKDISKALLDTTKKLLVSVSANLNKSSSVFTFINFNLVKILELSIINVARIDIIWNNLLGIINCTISNKEIENVSKFSVDILSSIAMFVLVQYKSKVNKTQPGCWDSKNWQTTLFKPFTLIASQQSHGILDTLLGNLNRILEKCGTIFNNWGWTTFIDILEKMLGNKEASSEIEKIFKVVEQIFNEYSSYLTIYNIEPLLNILEKFALSKENNNICYSSILLFWSCADIAENFQKSNVNLTENQKEIYKEYLPTKEKQDEYFQKEWKEMFNKLLNINSDERFDVRKSGINVFEQFFVAHITPICSLGVDEEIVEKIFFKILESNFQSYSKDKDSKEWEDTVVITLQAIGKIFKAFLEENKEDKKKEFLYKKLIEEFGVITTCSTPDINMNILKIISEISLLDKKLFDSNFNFVWAVLSEIGNYLQTETFIKKYSTFNIGSKLLMSMLETFKQIFIVKNSEVNDALLLQDENISNLLELIKKMLIISKNTEGNLPVTNPQRILRNEKEIFNFVCELMKFTSNEEILLKIYEFLNSYCVYDPKEQHSEALLRKSVECMEILFMNNCFNFESHVISLIDSLKPFILYRSNNDLVPLLIKSTKQGDLFLWSFITEELLKIISNFIYKMKDQSCWEKVIQLFEEIFKQSEVGYKAIERSFQEDLCKSSQEMEIQIINFIVDSLIPNSFYISSDLQKKLLSLLDIGSNLDYSTSFTNSLSLSKMCLSNLFDICRYKAEEQMKKEIKNPSATEEYITEYINIKKKIAKICTPILIKRCKDILKKYIEDEIKSGAMPLSRSRLEEVKFVLEKIKALEVFPGFYLEDNNEENQKKIENPSVLDVIMKKKKGHLFIFHNILSDFITTKETDIKMQVREIFKMISSEMGINEDK